MISSHLSQLIPPRLQRARERLAQQIWSQGERLALKQSRPSPRIRSRKETDDSGFRKITRYPTHWGKLFDQCWFEIQIPPRRPKGPLWLYWQDQAEATLHIDGVPWFGFDPAHRYSPLPKSFKEILVESVCLQSAIWHPEATGLDPQGSRLDGAWLMTRNDQAWAVYHDFSVLFDLAMDEYALCIPEGVESALGLGYKHPIHHATPLLRRLLSRLDRAVDALDQNGLEAMQSELGEIYRDLRADPLSLRCTLAGHSHIDLVWLWPERMAVQKTVHTFATVERLMEHYPEFRFTHSQPPCYQWVEEQAPPLFQRVKKRLDQGRWEATGTMEVESDTLLPCGEALARSFLFGQERFQQLRGSTARVVWLPDVFGYAACLPQIMRQAGAEYFFTAKFNYGTLNRVPHSSFLWKGHDGSEVLAHIARGKTGFNGTTSVAALRQSVRSYRQADVHDEVLVPTGYGDGGGGPTAEMCERARRMSDLAGMPRVEWDGVEPFFDRLNRHRSELPRYQGELYLEYHRGVFTTHGLLKERFRRAERAVQTWEAVRCATGGGPLPEEVWRRLIFGQFHDYIPGSSIWEACQEAFAELKTLGDRALSQAKAELTLPDSPPALFNPLPWERPAIIKTGRKTQRVLLPPLSGKPLTELAAAPDAPPVTVETNFLSNGLVEVRFDRQGRILHYQSGSETVQWAGPGGALLLFPDHPQAYDAWDIDRQTLALGKENEGKARVRVEKEGVFRGGLRFQKKLGRQSQVQIRYTLEAGDPFLRIEYDLDWREEQTLLKVAFPTRYHANAVRYGAPFGSVLRNQWEGRLVDEAMWENAGSRWAAVSDEGETEGLFIVTESKYGFACHQGNLTASLIRSALVTGEDPPHSMVVPGTLRRQSAPSPFSDLGRHRIRLAVGRYDTRAPWTEQPAALADSIFTPPLPYRGAAVDSGFQEVGQGTLVPCWARPLAKDQWVLRMHETVGRRGDLDLKLNPGYRATMVDLSGKPMASGSSEAAFRYGPFQILSARIDGSQ